MERMSRTHLEFTEGPDLAELMGRVAYDHGKMELLNEAMQTAMEMANHDKTKEGLIARFCKSRGQVLSLETKTGLHTISTTWSTDVKPHRPNGARFAKECSPITISDLIVGNTHHHRYLCGRVAVEPAFFCVSTKLLLEDINGDLVEVNIYQIPNPSTAKVSRMFPVGRGILVLEPFFKIRSDMTEGIRVEDPQDIMDWEYPTSCSQWKLLGNSFMNCKPVANAEHALTCYNAALTRSGSDFIQKQKDISTLFTNVGICSFREDNWTDCVWYCGAAVHLDPLNEKAWFWLVSSLVEVAEVARDHPTRFAAITILKHAGRRFNIRSNIWKPVWQKTTAMRLPSKLNKSDSWIATFDGEPAWCIATGVLKWNVSAGLVGDIHQPTSSFSTMEDARKRGKILFQQQRFADARSLYLEALSSLPPYRTAMQNVALVTGNKSAALLTIYDSQRAPEAMMESMVSAILDRTNPKPWLRQARVFLSLGREKRALDHLQAITSAIKKDASLRDETKSDILNVLTNERARITELCRHNKFVTEICDVPTEQQQEDRDRHRNMKDIDEYISLQGTMLQAMRTMAHTGPGRELFGPLSRRNSPKLHIEFPKLHGWPEGIDAVHADKVLYTSHLNSQSNPWLISVMLKKGDFVLEPSHLMKRWHGPGRMLEVSTRSEEISKGDILLAGEKFGFPDYRQMYDPRIRSSFLNSPCHPSMKLESGTVHVAVGFNDLNCLVSSLYHGPTDPSTTLEALTFVGIERSEYSLTKSLVIADLLAHESNLSVIFQVWYSSTWTRPTVESFRRSCQRVLDARELQPNNENERRIRSYLHCWLSSEPLRATDARKKWFEIAAKLETGNFADCCSLHRRIDRVAMVAYGLTGELLPSEALVDTKPVEKQTLPDQSRQEAKQKKKKRNKKNVEPSVFAVAEPRQLVGSLAMWSVPEGSAPFEGEHVFNHVTLESLLKELDGSDGTKNIVELLISLKWKQLRNMQMLLQKGEITISLKYGDIKPLSDPDGVPLLNEIAALKPQSMSWSHLMDYFPKSLFQEIACYCSEPGVTVHYGYSMNWISQVFGACVTDFISRDQAEINRILDICLGPSAVQEAKTTGVDKFLTVPFHDNPLNLCGNFLMHEVKHHWIKFFGSCDRWSKVGVKKGVAYRLLSSETLLPFPFHRNTRNIYLSWMYDVVGVKAHPGDRS